MIVIGYAFIRVTEASFIRYVSQNVAYTSMIILKRAVKAKLDLGLILLTALYMPLVYTMLEAMLCKCLFVCFSDSVLDFVISPLL